MTASIDRPAELRATAEPSRVPLSKGPAARAFRRVSGAGLALGLIGAASFVTVFVRLFESWRISPRAVSHHVSIFGLRLSYPAANAGALIVLGLALLGAIVLAIAVSAITGEVRGARRLAARLAQLDPVWRDGVFVIDGELPEAFCAGLFRPRIYISRGALATLDEESRRAVLVHERHHMRRRDPLRLAAARVLERAMFFLPAVREIRRSHELLAELSADESAVSGSGSRPALARAMLSFSEQAARARSAGIDPARVDYLLGDSPTWRFPTLAFMAAVLLLAIVVGVGYLVGRVASGSATLAPPFLSTQPCVLTLALIPCTAGLVGFRRAQSSHH